ncbi:unnamed protein product [Effrenium voratum]|uniref:Uncharacterized protein n=1 Tax=Effrenium voratum TaxID=2562239 RepID=A0AA36JKI5_9DINO|nr:unnamed protein product [Effrenium voratum]
MLLFRGQIRFAANFCPLLEQDIIKMRQSIEQRKQTYKEGRKRFMRGGNFSTSKEESQWAVRHFGEERERMRTEEKKIKLLEDRLEHLLQRFRRHCRR